MFNASWGWGDLDEDQQGSSCSPLPSFKSQGWWSSPRRFFHADEVGTDRDIPLASSHGRRGNFQHTGLATRRATSLTIRCRWRKLPSELLSFLWQHITFSPKRRRKWDRELYMKAPAVLVMQNGVCKQMYAAHNVLLHFYLGTFNNLQEYAARTWTNYIKSTAMKARK